MDHQNQTKKMDLVFVYKKRIYPQVDFADQRGRKRKLENWMNIYT